jgi:hypothetical protein
MKKLVIAMLLVTAALPTMASLSSAVVVAFPEPEPRTVATTLVMPADFVSVPIRVVSEQKNTAVAYEESRQAVEMISQKAKENGQFRTSTGVVHLSERRSSFGISSGSWHEPAAKADIYLLVPFTKERDNIFGAGAEAARFVETLSLPGKIRCELGNLQLAVENPEQYRAKLLGLIAQEIKKTEEAMAAQGNVKVEGLESPVMVRQVDDRQVELFVYYSLSITMNK